MLKHICGKCGEVFKNESNYLKHVCRLTGFTPKTSKHFEAFANITEKILVKGKAVKIHEKDILASVKEARKKG